MLYKDNKIIVSPKKAYLNYHLNLMIKSLKGKIPLNLIGYLEMLHRSRDCKVINTVLMAKLRMSHQKFVRLIWDSYRLSMILKIYYIFYLFNFLEILLGKKEMQLCLSTRRRFSRLLNRERLKYKKIFKHVYDFTALVHYRQFIFSFPELYYFIFLVLDLFFMIYFFKKFCALSL